MPELLLRVERRNGRVFAKYLSPGDVAWVRRMLDVLAAGAGRTRAEVEARLTAPHYDEAALARRGMARILLADSTFVVAAQVPPRELRARVFAERALEPLSPREVVLARSAARLEISSGGIDSQLYADLPAAHVLARAPGYEADAAISRYNLSLLRGVLATAESLTFTARAESCAALRGASLQRLLCHARRASDGEVEVTLFGPVAVVRRTRKYGPAFARCASSLCRAPGWQMRAMCVLRGERALFEASARDPIGAAPAGRRFDSKAEERLYRELLRMTAWRIEREPEPLDAGGRLFFPDLGVTLPSGARVLVEIVGFWTPEYLQAKLAAVRAARGTLLVLCVDESLRVGAGELGDMLLLRYRRTVDPAALIDLIEKTARR